MVSPFVARPTERGSGGFVMSDQDQALLQRALDLKARPLDDAEKRLLVRQCTHYLFRALLHTDQVPHDAIRAVTFLEVIGAITPGRAPSPEFLALVRPILASATDKGIDEIDTGLGRAGMWTFGNSSTQGGSHNTTFDAIRDEAQSIMTARGNPMQVARDPASIDRMFQQMMDRHS